MFIDGWAHLPNSKELQKKLSDRYREIEKYKKYIFIESIDLGYNHKNYIGRILDNCPIEIREKDIAILMDRGNLCFGGWCEIHPDKTFYCRISID